ncbi:MAG: nucleotidyltransferase substrate binding protein [Nitrospinae bacterium]|nr:nucleotidyltransferase substrate binding protein [Nitrospinota bacterium]
MAATPEELPPLNILLNQLDWNLQWLQQMEKNEPTDYFRDAALQRFEFTFNTAVKCIQGAARQIQDSCDSPEKCFALAERKEWVPGGIPWKNIVEDFQSMKTDPAQENADALFAKLTQYRELFKTLFDRLSALDADS